MVDRRARDAEAERDQACPAGHHGTYLARRTWHEGIGCWGPWTGCEQCEREREEAEATRRQAEAAARRQARLDSYLRLCGCWGRFEQASFETYGASTPQQRAALAACRAYAADFDPRGGGGLLLLGRPGTGKTHLAAAIGRHLLLTRDLKTEFTTVREIVRQLRDTWRRDAGESEREVVERLASRDLLVIDDAGVGFGSEAEQVQLLEVVDARYRQRAPTVLTSNLNLPMLAQALGERTVDRLQEAARVIVCDWPSHRRIA